MGDTFNGLVPIVQLVEQHRAGEAMAREARDRIPR
jgi:hypothetical protein